MLTVPLTFSLAPLPTGMQLNADDYAHQIIANLQASFSGNFMTGQTLGTEPTTDIGPWFDGEIWWAFSPNQNQYAPLVSLPSYNSVINGQFQVWQRQTGFVINPGFSAYTADRYISSSSLVSGAANINRVGVSLLTGFPLTVYALRITSTTAQNVLGANELFHVTHRVERQIANPLFNVPTSLTIVLRSNVIGSYGVSVRSIGGNFSYVHECTLNAANVPQAFLIENIPPMPTASGNWGALDTDASYIISVCAASGTNWWSNPDIWTAANVLTTSNQANLFSAVSNYLDISYLQHEPGRVCNPLSPVPFDLDLRRCQRYYAKSYSYPTFPGVVSQVGEVGFITTATTNAWGSARFPVQMRVTPAITFYSPITGAINTVRSQIQVLDIGGISSGTEGDQGFDFLTTTGSWTTANNVLRFQYVANAEL